MKGSFLPLPCLVLVTDRTLCQDAPLVEKVRQAVAGGVTAVQLREKDLPAAELLRLAEELRRVTAGRALILVNDRLDVALAAAADGVHLPENGLPVAAARRLLGRPDGVGARPGDCLVGRSVHSVAEALRAQEEGADYIELGTIYPTPSHPDAVPAGPGLIEDAARSVRIPILAIGGVSADNVGEAVRAGASGAAVISAILGSPQPEDATRRLRAALDAAWAEARR